MLCFMKFVPIEAMKFNTDPFFWDIDIYLGKSQDRAIVDTNAKTRELICYEPTYFLLSNACPDFFIDSNTMLLHP